MTGAPEDPTEQRVRVNGIEFCYFEWGRSAPEAELGVLEPAASDGRGGEA